MDSVIELDYIFVYLNKLTSRMRIEKFSRILLYIIETFYYSQVKTTYLPGDILYKHTEIYLLDVRCDITVLL